MQPIEFYNYRIKSQDQFLNDKSADIIDFINRKIASLQTLEEIMDFLFLNMQEIIPCDRIAVSFFEENGRRLTIYYVKANYQGIKLGKGYSADIDNSSLEKVFADGTPRIINDLHEYLKTHPASDTTKLLVEEGISSSITVPLSVEGRPVGLLFLSSKERNIYTESHLIKQMMIVERLGQAVEKTYRIEKLSEAVNSYMEMLGFVSHELKSSLDSIMSLGVTLANGYFGDIDEKHKEYVMRMVNKAKYLKDMTAEYLTLSRFESNMMVLNLTDADFENDILNECMDIIKPQADEKKITINRHISEGIKVQCDVTLLKIVLNNLLSNAIKYSDLNGIVDVTLTSDGKEAVMSVKNTGPGFPQGEKSRLFRKFSRLEKGELMQRKGTGIGLYTSWKIIQLHGGHIWADSKENEWAQFSFRIPLNKKSK